MRFYVACIHKHIKTHELCWVRHHFLLCTETADSLIYFQCFRPNNEICFQTAPENCFAEVNYDKVISSIYSFPYWNFMLVKIFLLMMTNSLDAVITQASFFLSG